MRMNLRAIAESVESGNNNVDKSKEALIKEAREAEMVHPLTGKTVKQAFFSEGLANRGIKFLDFLEQLYVPVKKHESMILDFQEKINELSTQNAKLKAQITELENVQEVTGKRK